MTPQQIVKQAALNPRRKYNPEYSINCFRWYRIAESRIAAKVKVTLHINVTLLSL